ncbi:MAG: response regulator [Clostridiaceae bacterium]
MYRLLIIDDEKDIRDNMKLLIDWKRFGINHILTAASYEEALCMVVDFKPHIALVDVSIGSKWGYDLIKGLKENGSETHYIMISGYDNFEYVRLSMKNGAVDYLLKPIDTNALETVIENIIVNSLKGSIAKNPEEESAMDPILNAPVDSFSKITNKILLLIHSQYSSNLSLTDIAELFKMNSKYIGRIFIKDTGMKFSEYLTAYRMLKAKELIETTDEKIAVIASLVGYDYLNNFYVHFKAHYNISPSDLRIYNIKNIGL